MGKKRQDLFAPPIEWVNKIEHYAERIRRLRMLWRRGRSAYRPMVPFDTDLAVLEHEPHSEWERLELPETHFEWTTEAEGDERTEQVLDVVEDLWQTAAAWTRASNSARCDFQLVAYDEAGEILFEEGRQCRLGARPAPRPTPGDDEVAWTRPQRVIASVLERKVDYASYDRAVERLDGRRDQFIGRLIDDREWAAQTARTAMSGAPQLLEQAGELLQRTIGYQHSVVETLQDQSEARAEADMHRVSEEQKTRRRELGLIFGGKVLDTVVGSAGNLLGHAAELLKVHRTTTVPQFVNAQEAMSFLLCSISAERLCRMCKGNRKAASALLAVLDAGSRFSNERDALYHATELIMLLRSEQFEEHAKPEEYFAGRFIIARYATFKANDLKAS